MSMSVEHERRRVDSLKVGEGVECARRDVDHVEHDVDGAREPHEDRVGQGRVQPVEEEAEVAGAEETREAEQRGAPAQPE